MGYEKVVLILYLSTVMLYEYDALEIGSPTSIIIICVVFYDLILRY